MHSEAEVMFELAGNLTTTTKAQSRCIAGSLSQHACALPSDIERP